MIAARFLVSGAPRRLMCRAAGGSFSRASQRRVTTAFNRTHTQHLRIRAQNYTTTAGNITTPAEHLEPQQLLQDRPALDVPLLVSVLRQENALDICVIRVAPELRYTDHMIIVSGSSPRHLNAMSALVLKVFKFVRKDEERHVRLEGRDCDDWKCVDFGSTVIHFMLPEVREVYELEKLWTLRSYDEQLQRIPTETIPPDFIVT